MEKARQIQWQFWRSKRLPWLVIGLALAVLAGTILAGCLRLRNSVREQIAGRDGEILYQVARWQQQFVDQGDGEALDPITEPTEQFNLILKISQIKGVVGIRLFAPDGTFRTAFPATITEGTLSAADLSRLKTLQTASHFYPAADLASFDMLSELKASGERVPLLEVNVPLHAGAGDPLAGVGQFIISGDSIAREYAALDGHLLLHGSAAFVAAGGILTFVLALAFRTISKQTERLVEANQELVQAAKTSAVGALTSHLIHGLRNPLSGLQGFVQSHLDGEPAAVDSDWQDAMATTQRMQALISGVVRILEEQQTAAGYEISWQELMDLISAKLLPVAQAIGLQFDTQVATEGMLTNRDANLVLLILENLIQNAFQATPKGKSVRLHVTCTEGIVQCDVQDEGPGLPADLSRRLFTPCRSTKAGGSGIGLAISKQMATQIGAILELRSTSSRGCVFRLSLPLKIAVGGPVGGTLTIQN